MDTSSIQATLARSPYRELVKSITGPANGLRFFRGCEPTLEDFNEGWGIFRSVMVGSERKSFDDFAMAFSNAPAGSIFLLRANTGEGKTTLLRQLAWRLQHDWLVLYWSDLARHNPAMLRDLHEGGLNVLVLAEIMPSTSSAVVNDIGQQLRSNPLPCPLLVCGAANDVLRARFNGVTHIKFAGLNYEVPHLVAQLRKAFLESTQEAVKEVAPTLPLFMNDPDPAIFATTSLFVGMLKATYGDGFRDRLAGEYRNLSEPGNSPIAQRIYMLACYTHGIDSPLSMRLITRLAGKDISAVLYRYDEGQPWEIREAGVWARHRIVAQTVLLEMKLLGEVPFRSFLNVLFQDHLMDVEHIHFIGELLAAYARWQRLDGMLEGPERGQVRKAIRAYLEREAAWISKAQAMVLGKEKYWTATSWAMLMFELLPNDLYNPHARVEVSSLMAMHQSWIQIAGRLADPSDRARIRYWKTKADLIKARSEGDRHVVAVPVLQAWKALLPQRNLGISFYVDLAELAFDYTVTLTDRSHLMEWYEVAVAAVENASALTDRSQERIGTLYAKILNRAVGRLDRRDFNTLLEKAWGISLGLDYPNAQTGCFLAERLMDEGDQMRAKEVLKTILASRVYGEALFLLSKTCATDPATQDFIAGYVDTRRSDFESIAPLTVAYMLLSVAALKRYRTDTAGEISELEAACSYYEQAAKARLKNMWEGHGTVHWKSAISRLRELSSPNADACESAWQAAANEYAALKILVDKR